MSVYNQAKYLAQSIDSILKQTFTGFELILVDDASTDNSLEIMQEHAALDNRIKIIINSRNLGLTKSLNVALREAKGKYIARQDGDDISYSNRLQKQYDFLEENDDIALVGIKYISVNLVTGKRNCRDLPKEHIDILNWIESGINPIANMIMARKDIVLAVGGYNENIRYAQDYALYHAISRKYKLANIVEPLAEIRFHDENITVNKRKEQHGYILYVLEDAFSKISFDEFYPKCIEVFENRQNFQSQLVELFNNKMYGKCVELFQTNKYEYKIERIPRAYYIAASSFELLNDTTAAIEIFENISNLKYADVSLVSGSLFHLGEIYLKQDDSTKAVLYFEKCLQKKNHKKAKEYIDKIKERV